MAVKWKQPCPPGRDGHLVLGQQKNPTTIPEMARCTKWNISLSLHQPSPARCRVLSGLLGMRTARADGVRQSFVSAAAVAGLQKPGNAKHSI